MDDASTSVDLQAIVLVEGESDRAALETLARRHGIVLDGVGVAVVPTGGATSMGRFVERYGPRGAGVRVAGLCDAREEPGVRRALERGGLGPVGDRDAMAALGFHVCDADLEDELIRALGTANVEQVLDAEGDLRSFRRFQHQPAQRAVTVERQLRRFLGTRSGRKIHYARVLVEALDLAAAPRPLDALLDDVASR